MLVRTLSHKDGNIAFAKKYEVASKTVEQWRRARQGVRLRRGGRICDLINANVLAIPASNLTIIVRDVERNKIAQGQSYRIFRRSMKPPIKE